MAEMSQTLKLVQALEKAKEKAAYWSKRVEQLEEKYHKASGVELEKILKDSGVDMADLKTILAQMKKPGTSTTAGEK